MDILTLFFDLPAKLYATLERVVSFFILPFSEVIKPALDSLGLSLPDSVANSTLLQFTMLEFLLGAGIGIFVGFIIIKWILDIFL